MSAVTRLIYVANAGTVATPVFSFSTIDLLNPAVITAAQQLKVYIRRVGSPFQTVLTHITDYTIDTSLKNVTLEAGVNLALGDIIVINRETPLSERQIDFEGLSYLNATTLDDDGDNLLHLIQEIFTQTGYTLKRSTDLTVWDAEGVEVANGAPATDADSLVTLAQVQAIVGAGEVVDLNTVQTFVFETGVDGTTTYTLTDAGLGFANPSKLVVTVNSVLQIPDYDSDADDEINLGSGAYTITNTDSVNPQLVFHEAPDNGSIIVVRTISGMVNALLNTEIVDGGAIADGSLNLSALGFTGSGDNRFIVVNNSNVATLGTASLSQLTAPTAPLSVGSQRITGLDDPVDPTDAVNLRSIPSAADAGSRIDLNDNTLTSGLSYPHNLATGKNNGLWLVVLTGTVNDTGSGASYTASVTINGSAFAVAVGNHPDGTAPFTVARIITVADGNITISASSNVRTIASFAGYKVG